VSDAFKKASEERLKHLQSKLNEAIKLMEASLLLATRFDSVSPPPDVERFQVSPPELDELERWVRQANEAILRAVEDEELRLMAEEAQAAGRQAHTSPAATARPAGPQTRQSPPPPPPQRPGGLWTPGQR
jgi:hypothetical protein